MPGRRLIPPWTWVTVLTAAAVAVVAVLAVQANRGPHPAAADRVKASQSASAHASPAPESTAVPDGSGSGRRIVYSLGERRVWLIDVSDQPRRTFTVWPGTVSPGPGAYTVESRKDATTGYDGVTIEHIVYFAADAGVSIAFSNAVDGSSPPPTSATRTGGIRMHKQDGAALWAFGTVGTAVRVVR